MTALRASEIDGLLRRGPDAQVRVCLVFGPDAGLVSERAARLVALYAKAPDDPFALVRLDGDVLASDPGRLVDEAGTLGLFGESRTIVVRAGSRSIAPAVEALLKIETEGAPVVIEAGDLARSAPLRTLCEASRRALAIPCYPDDAGTLAALIDARLGERGLSIEREARALMAEHLGSDRRASLAEIEKLALFADGRGRVGIEDVEAVVSDVGTSALTTAIDAAFAGRIPALERELRRLRQDGLDNSVLLGAALRQALGLMERRLSQPEGSPSALTAGWRGLHFRRKAIVEAQFARWSVSDLRRVVVHLQAAVLACRRSQGGLADAQASAALLDLARAAAARRD